MIARMSHPATSATAIDFGRTAFVQVYFVFFGSEKLS